VPAIALLDPADGFDQVVDIVFAGFCAKTANVDRPRLGLPALVGVDLGIFLIKPPFVKIVISGDVVVRRQLNSGQLVGRIQRIGKSEGRGARRRRQQCTSCQPEAAGPQKLSPSKILGLRSHCRVGQLPGMFLLDKRRHENRAAEPSISIS
jgi:hypothetical protein